MTKKISINEKISLLWVVVMFTMVFADILSFVTPGMMKQVVDGTTDVKITQPMLLVFAVLLQIPIIMIFLSRVLKRKVNRILNIVASVVTILFVVAGGSRYLHYYFFASIEVLCMIYIIVLSIKWKED